MNSRTEFGSFPLFRPNNFPVNLVGEKEEDHPHPRSSPPSFVGSKGVLMSAKRKEVYLRKHGLTPRSPRSSSEDLSGELSGELSGRSSSSAVPSRSPSTLRAAERGQQQSWASKRRSTYCTARASRGCPQLPWTSPPPLFILRPSSGCRSCTSQGCQVVAREAQEAFMATA